MASVISGSIMATTMPKRLRLSSSALILANIVPLFGVLLWDWSVSSIVILYWFENVVLGVLNIARMMLFSPSTESLLKMAPPATGEQSRKAREALERIGTGAAHGIKLFLIPFFAVHYFAFCAGHGVFVFSMFPDEDGFFGDTGGINLLGTLGHSIEIFSTPLAFAAVVLVASHTFSFVQNTVLGREYEQLDIRRIMGMPYGRIVVLHITIILGGFVTMALGSPVWVLLILILLKTGVDLKLHWWEHRKLGADASATV